VPSLLTDGGEESNQSPIDSQRCLPKCDRLVLAGKATLMNARSVVCLPSVWAIAL
jgi:hypothetical protein